MTIETNVLFDGNDNLFKKILSKPTSFKPFKILSLLLLDPMK